MTLATQMTADLGVFFAAAEHAQTVTYNGSAILGIPDHGKLMDAESGSVLRRKTIWVKAADVPAPAYRDTVVIGSDTWYVGPEEDHKTDGYVWELPLYRDERPVI